MKVNVASVRHEMATGQARLDGEIAELTIRVEELKGEQVKLKGRLKQHGGDKSSRKLKKRNKKRKLKQ